MERINCFGDNCINEHKIAIGNLNQHNIFYNMEK